MTSRPTIGIIGAGNERHCVYLADELRKQGAEPLIMDNTSTLPFPLTLGTGSGMPDSYYNDHSLKDVQVFYLRALYLPTPAFNAQPLEAQIRQEGYVAYAAQRERYAAWLSYLKCLPLQNKLLVNPIDRLLIHFAKPFQMAFLHREGIPVPATLVTSEAAQVKAFANGRDVVYKPVAGGAHCRKLSQEDLEPERLAALANAPVMFQQLVPGQEVRVFVLDGKVLGAFAIESSAIDYRTGEAAVTATEISAAVAKLSIRACRALGLLFSGVDVKLGSDGSAVLLECNPSPMFEGFDRHAEVSIVSQLASFLIQEAAARSAVGM
ncbi:ATP-grasp domain-containing protein [Paenibacillus xerothermodurans]|uniref:ATP-dependent carboxylate-amine ligase n=1 Tax=Paenibacillus xerothermodurans TaxID=1977292 RepID=A0A2W1NQM8_PAEXE|nr:ATP-dependent carboxylate-amine ligase [Paenibacillus xerothermodurans]PZE20036.1 ATP-dependent carboxylate-amine ligase [Paenibacillus xerothermodurans]